MTTAEVTGWFASHIIGLLVTTGILGYCAIRYHRQNTPFNMAMLVEPSLCWLIHIIKVVSYFKSPENKYFCGDSEVASCKHATYQLVFLGQLGMTPSIVLLRILIPLFSASTIAPMEMFHH